MKDNYAWLFLYLRFEFVGENRKAILAKGNLTLMSEGGESDEISQLFVYNYILFTV